MGVSAGAESWALAAGVLGAILTVTGAHMTLTWPFAKYFPFDNIIFSALNFFTHTGLVVHTMG